MDAEASLDEAFRKAQQNSIRHLKEHLPHSFTLETLCPLQRFTQDDRQPPKKDLGTDMGNLSAIYAPWMRNDHGDFKLTMGVFYGLCRHAEASEDPRDPGCLHGRLRDPKILSKEEEKELAMGGRFFTTRDRLFGHMKWRYDIVGFHTCADIP